MTSFSMGWGAMPAGAVSMYAGAAAPAGWLICDGASLLRTAYPALYSAIGVTFGAADGTHFSLPDCRGRAPIGVGTGAGLTARALAATGGTETHQLTIAEMPAHDHNLDIASIAGAEQCLQSTGPIAPGPGDDYCDDRGGDAAHENMSPFLAMTFIVRY